MMQVFFPLNTIDTLVKTMDKTGRYRIAKCSSERPCPKCHSISDPIVVNRGTHYTLYCSQCGAYIKHASVEDKRHMYATKAIVKDGTPIKVCMLWDESERTMIQ